MDGYGGYKYPYGSNSVYNTSPVQRSTQTNISHSHIGRQQESYASGQQESYGGQYGYDQYPGLGMGISLDQYQNYLANSDYLLAKRIVYPQYGCAEGDRIYNQSSGNSANSISALPVTQRIANNTEEQGSIFIQSSATTLQLQQHYNQPLQQGYPHAVSGQMYPNGSASKTIFPPILQPKTYLAFAKEHQQHPLPAQQTPQIYSLPNSYLCRGQYQAANMGPSSLQMYNQEGGRTRVLNKNKYVNNLSGFQGSMVLQGSQLWSSMLNPSIRQNINLCAPLGPHLSFTSYPPQPIEKRGISFLPDSVETTIPVLYKRKRICQVDIGNIDAWKIMMSLRSGLVAETTYALDTLNILLFDDSTVSYFGLNHWPGLLDLLLEHFHKNLNDMFDSPIFSESDVECYQSERFESSTIDLCALQEPSPENHEPILNKTPNYTYVSRKNQPVKLIEKNENIFIEDKHKYVNPITTEYILPNFPAEFNNIQFFQYRKKENLALKPKIVCKSKVDLNQPNTSDYNTTTNLKQDEKVTKSNKDEKNSDKKKCMKSLSDTISQINKKIDENGENTSSDGADERKSNDKNPELHVKDIAGILKRRRMSDYEDECYTRDEASLFLITETQDAVAKRCVCISTILRNLTFIPGNEIQFAKNTTYLSLTGKLLLLYHEHPILTQKTQNYNRKEDTDFANSCSSLHSQFEWWWDYLLEIRENVLVSCANISGHVDFSEYNEEIARPVLDGLLHWAVCSSTYGDGPFTNIGQTSLVSPQSLALESLSKLCVTDANVDLVIITPPFSRLERLCAVLTKHLYRSEEELLKISESSEGQKILNRVKGLREFSVNLLHYLSAANSTMARMIAMQDSCIPLLVAFIEQAEQSACNMSCLHGVLELRDNPELIGISIVMLRRAASTLLYLSKHPDNRPLFMQQEKRLLQLAMSIILNPQVTFVIAQVLYQISLTSDESSRSDIS